MKFKDLFNFRMSEHGKALKGGKTDEELDVALETQTLPDERVIEFESLEEGKEVFLIVEGEEPALIKDETLTLEDGQMVVVDAEGLIAEIKPKEEEPPAVELSEEQKHLIELATKVSAEDLEKLVDLKKNGWYTIELSVQDGRIVWADMYTETYEALLSEQVDPIRVELEAEKKENVKLQAQVKILQELKDDDQINPLKRGVNLENEKELTPYEIQLGINK